MKYSLKIHAQVFLEMVTDKSVMKTFGFVIVGFYLFGGGVASTYAMLQLCVLVIADLVTANFELIPGWIMMFVLLRLLNKWIGNLFDDLNSRLDEVFEKWDSEELYLIFE